MEYNFQHKELAAGRWKKFTFAEQMGNIGSEVSRAIKWRGREEKYFNNAVDRALELIDLTIADRRWRSRLKEILLLREVLCDIVFGEKQYKTDLVDLDKYLFNFAVLARR